MSKTTIQVSDLLNRISRSGSFDAAKYSLQLRNIVKKSSAKKPMSSASAQGGLIKVGDNLVTVGDKILMADNKVHVTYFKDGNWSMKGSGAAPVQAKSPQAIQ